MSPIRTLVALADAPLVRRACASAALRLVERLTLVAATYAFVATRRRDALLVAAALAIVFALRSAARSAAHGAAQRRLHRAAVEALLAGDVLRGAVLPDEDAQTAVFEGIHHGGRVLYDLVPDLAGDALAAVLLAAFLVAVEPPRLLVVGVVALLVAAAAIVLVRRITFRASERAWRAYQPVVDRLVGALGARLEIVASGRDAAYLAHFDDALREWRASSARSEALAALAGRAPMVAAAVAVGGTLLVDRALRGAFDAAALGQAAIVASVVPAFAGLARDLHELVKSGAKFAPMARLLATERAAAERRSPTTPVARLPLPARTAPITWDRVSFAYTMPDGAEGPLALDDISFTWSDGEVLVLAGPNGSGKSTCLRLLLGLAPPAKGAVRVGGVDLAALDLPAFRRGVAYLPQRPFLPERATVRDALRLLADEATDAALRDALERVGVWGALEAARRSPLDAPVATLSVGQRQRVALARVLVQNAPIVLLDEPDANLDTEGVTRVARLARELARDRRVAVVAHGEAMIAAGDRVVRLAAGRVVAR